MSCTGTKVAAANAAAQTAWLAPAACLQTTAAGLIPHPLCLLLAEAPCHAHGLQHAALKLAWGPVLVGTLHVPSTQVTVSRHAEAEQSVSALCCTLVMRREQDWSQMLSPVLGCKPADTRPDVRRQVQTGDADRLVLACWCTLRDSGQAPVH